MPGARRAAATQVVYYLARGTTGTSAAPALDLRMVERRPRGGLEAGIVVSTVLPLIWISGWAVLPLIVDVVLLWSVLALRVAVESLRG